MGRRKPIRWGEAGWATPGGRKKPAPPRPRKPAPSMEVMAPVLAALGVPAGQRIICDWPPVECSPNYHGQHPAKISPVKKGYRQACWALALEAKLTAPAGRVAIRLDFFPPDRRARDDDNAQGAFKHGRDGIAAALKVDDSRFDVTPVLHSAPHGCVVVTILEEAA